MLMAIAFLGNGYCYFCYTVDNGWGGDHHQKNSCSLRGRHQGRPEHALSHYNVFCACVSVL